MMTFRKFELKDAKEISLLIRQALKLVNSKDYPEDNIKFMVDYFSPETVIELAQKRYMLIALNNTKIVGTGSLAGDTIYTVFVDPKEQGKGIGKKIMGKLEKLAKERQIRFLKVPSSITALKFYLKLGFKKEKEEMLPRSGLIIHMSKALIESA